MSNLYHRHPTSTFGFLPNINPLTSLGENSKYSILDSLGRNIPTMLESRTFKKSIVSHLPLLKIGQVSKMELDRLMLLYSFFASAYIHENPEKQSDHIPKEIAIPLCDLAKRLNRPPILTYDSYALCNWKVNDPTKEFGVDNLSLLQNFLGGPDEDWFILIHVDIEQKASKVLAGIAKINRKIGVGSLMDIETSLDVISKGMKEINDVMDRMPEKCAPEVYYKSVRPYIFGFSDVTYEGVNTKPISYRGETGAQSSIVPAMVSALGIIHKDSMLTKHLDDMRQYMPIEHQGYLVDIAKIGNILRAFITLNPTLSSAYNDCIKQLVKFRTIHLNYAIDYIQNRVDNPTGTGGTPYVQWLSKLIEETESHMFK